jgi:uncharacterized protein (TIGR03067 family)
MFVLSVITASILVGADAEQDQVKKDIEKLKGTWSLSMLDDGHGLEAPDTDDVKGRTLTITDKEIEMRKDGKILQKLAYKIDPAKKPKTIDLTPDTLKGQVGLCIYAVEGDELKIVFRGDAKSSSQRPAEFKGDAKAGLLYTVWKREKK